MSKSQIERSVSRESPSLSTVKKFKSDVVKLVCGAVYGVLFFVVMFLAINVALSFIGWLG